MRFFLPSIAVVFSLLTVTSASTQELLSGNFDIGLAISNIPTKEELQSAPMVQGPIIIELTGEPLADHVKDTSHALIESAGMFPDDTRCLISIEGICVIRGHRLEIR